MIDIEKPKIEIAEISDDNRYGKFICEPSASRECSMSSPRSRGCATTSRTSC